MNDDEESCRVEMIDGETVRVTGADDWDDTDRAMFAEIVRAVKAKYAAEKRAGSHQDAATVEVALGSTATTNGPQIGPEVAGSQHATTDHTHGRGAGDGVGL